MARCPQCGRKKIGNDAIYSFGNRGICSDCGNKNRVEKETLESDPDYERLCQEAQDRAYEMACRLLQKRIKR